MSDKLLISTDNRNRRNSDSDERMLSQILGFERSIHDQIAAIATKVILIESEQKYMLSKIDTLVSKLEFTPVKLLVYGMTGIILAGVIGALLTLIIRK